MPVSVRSREEPDIALLGLCAICIRLLLGERAACDGVPSVYGAEASPWPSGCLVTIESRTRRYVGLHGEPCAHIAIGDKAVFNHEPDVIFWVDDKPYSVKSASKK